MNQLQTTTETTTLQVEKLRPQKAEDLAYEKQRDLWCRMHDYARLRMLALHSLALIGRGEADAEECWRQYLDFEKEFQEFLASEDRKHFASV